MLNLRSPANLRNVIKIAVRVGLFQVNGGRNLVVLHGDERGGDTRGATGALRGSNLGFERRHWDFIGMVAQRQLERARFNAIVQVDRKSTRLNSSHANISYAVFCLKKKKKKNR